MAGALTASDGASQFKDLPTTRLDLGELQKMETTERAAPLSADAHAEGMTEYFREGRERALRLGNRGPLLFDSQGRLHADIRTENMDFTFLKA